MSGCEAVVLAPSGDIAARQRDILLVSTWLMLLIIVPVMVATAWFAWKYRASNRKAEYAPHWHHSTLLELAIWTAPLLIIICLGAITWVGTHLVDPYRPLDRIAADRPVPADVQPLEIQVVSLDWKWLFIYPEEGIATVNVMAVPVDRPVRFHLTSSNVMNAFYIPAMAGMIYTMPAMETRLNGVMNREGVYDGFSSHYSGAGFSGMRFKAHALDEAGYAAWVEEVRASAETLDRPGYLELERPSENVAPRHFSSVDPELFRRVINICVAEGRMCMNEMMAYDAQGGIGLAGVMNTVPAPQDATALRRPVLGPAPFVVTGFCTVEEARDAGTMAQLRIHDPRPLRGHGISPFSMPRARGIADGAPVAGFVAPQL
ncbi:ubiquinol oxidase subunit II [Pseudogemmobacter sonorensis]|uniref:ubiquinol oxidase subunit II n=1 Tax=Pseudogemmobacter sonorensis TaxID=2989681 RepID=UPI003F675EAE